MKSKVTQIREMSVIEKELNAGRLGVLAFNSEDEEIIQTVEPFLYADKNIYFFFEETDEIYSQIIYENNVSFTVYKTDNQKKNAETASSYKFVQVKCLGTIKKVDEIKTAEELYRQFVKKYTSTTDEERNESLSGVRAIFIDTEEIQASDIQGL
ncbi:MAG: pyridoxamine 5'-phosphate oxidase family protein [Ignavibacteriales bacterium]